LIHGKYAHEETRATASRTMRHAGGRYLVIRNIEEAGVVCAYVRGRGDRAAFLARFAPACSEGFDADPGLQRLGLANQTTMLSSESLAIQEMIRAALADRHGEAAVADRFRAFDTICSATQDRQDAIVALVARRPDRMLVIGGYNSSNTTHLAAMAARSVPTYHIEDASCIEPGGSIRHKPYGAAGETTTPAWLPAGPVTL